MNIHNISLLLLLFTILSCDTKSKFKINTDKGDTLRDIIENELKTGVRFDTIVLGFTFGMSKDSYNKRIEKLIDEGTLYIKDEFVYYDMYVDTEKGTSEKYESSFNAEFHNNKLYQFGIAMEPKQINYDNIALANDRAQIKYRKKYGSPDLEIHDPKTHESCYSHIWVNGNRKITILCGNSDNRIFYADTKVLKEINN